MSRGLVVAGIDPGLANCGLAAVRLGPGGEADMDILEAGVVKTEKSDKKLEVRQSSDNVRRAQELLRALVAFGGRHHLAAVAVEAMSFPRNSSAAMKMGMAWGVISSWAHGRGLAIVQASPQDIKRTLCGVKNASKTEMCAAVEVIFPRIIWPKRAGDWEHAADAVGAVLACVDSQVLQAVRLATETEVSLIGGKHENH